MNILLWALQVALAWFCIAGGAFQIFKLDDLKKGVAAMRELPKGLWMFLGAFGCLTGVGLLLPGILGILPGVTAMAAVAIALQSLLITGFYLRFGDKAPVSYTVVMALLAGFVAYGRFELVPM